MAGFCLGRCYKKSSRCLGRTQAACRLSRPLSISNLDENGLPTVACNALGISNRDRATRYPCAPGLQHKVVRLAIAPRSIYRMEHEARWGWQHSVDPTVEPRWSVTLRTKARPRDRSAHPPALRPSLTEATQRQAACSAPEARSVSLPSS